MVYPHNKLWKVFQKGCNSTPNQPALLQCPPPLVSMLVYDLLVTSQTQQKWCMWLSWLSRSQCSLHLAHWKAYFWNLQLLYKIFSYCEIEALAMWRDHSRCSSLSPSWDASQQPALTTIYVRSTMFSEYKLHIKF